MRTLVLQHIACEPPGLYEDILRERGSSIDRVEIDAGEALPDWRDFDLLVAMGGPMSVNDERELPWLVAEKRFIAEAVRGGLPFWGACLGVQLLAASLGARVYAGPKPEVGLLPVFLTDEALRDPVFAGQPRALLTVQFHGDTFDLPEGAIRLASSPGYANQAFSWKQAYGIQFHLEISPDMVKEWLEVPAYAEYLDRVLGSGGGTRFLEDISTRIDELHRHGRRLFEAWVDTYVKTASTARADVRGG